MPHVVIKRTAIIKTHNRIDCVWHLFGRITQEFKFGDRKKKKKRQILTRASWFRISIFFFSFIESITAKFCQNLRQKKSEWYQLQLSSEKSLSLFVIVNVGSELYRTRKLKKYGIRVMKISVSNHVNSPITFTVSNDSTYEKLLNL